MFSWDKSKLFGLSLSIILILGIGFSGCGGGGGSSADTSSSISSDMVVSLAKNIADNNNTLNIIASDYVTYESGGVLSTLEYDNNGVYNITLEVPAEALSTKEKQLITIETVYDEYNEHSSEIPTIVLSPKGLEFSKPITITYKYTPNYFSLNGISSSDELDLVHFGLDGSQKDINVTEFNDSNGTLKVQIDNFSGLATFSINKIKSKAISEAEKYVLNKSEGILDSVISIFTKNKYKVSDELILEFVSKFTDKAMNIEQLKNIEVYSDSQNSISLYQYAELALLENLHYKYAYIKWLNDDFENKFKVSLEDDEVDKLQDNVESILIDIKHKLEFYNEMDEELNTITSLPIIGNIFKFFQVSSVFLFNDTSLDPSYTYTSHLAYSLNAYIYAMENLDEGKVSVEECNEIIDITNQLECKDSLAYDKTFYSSKFKPIKVPELDYYLFFPNIVLTASPLDTPEFKQWDYYTKLQDTTKTYEILTKGWPEENNEYFNQIVTWYAGSTKWSENLGFDWNEEFKRFYFIHKKGDIYTTSEFNTIKKEIQNAIDNNIAKIEIKTIGDTSIENKKYFYLYDEGEHIDISVNVISKTTEENNFDFDFEDIEIENETSNLIDTNYTNGTITVTNKKIGKGVVKVFYKKDDIEEVEKTIYIETKPYSDFNVTIDTTAEIQNNSRVYILLHSNDSVDFNVNLALNADAFSEMNDFNISSKYYDSFSRNGNTISFTAPETIDEEKYISLDIFPLFFSEDYKKRFAIKLLKDEPPVADFTLDTITGTVTTNIDDSITGFTVKATSTSIAQQGTISSLEWYLDNVKQNSSSFYIDSVGTHDIKLVVENSFGKTDTKVLSIEATETPRPENPTFSKESGIYNISNIGDTISLNINDNGEVSLLSPEKICYSINNSFDLINCTYSSATQNPTLEIEEGNTTISAVVINNDGVMSEIVSESYNVILVENQLPVADAGTDQTVIFGDIVYFQGSNSSDKDGSIESYKWIYNGEVLSTLSSFSKSDFSVGIHNITLTVIDDKGGIDTDIIIVTVNEAESQQEIMESALIGDWTGTGSATVSGQTCTYNVSINVQKHINGYLIGTYDLIDSCGYLTTYGSEDFNSVSIDENGNLSLVTYEATFTGKLSSSQTSASGSIYYYGSDVGSWSLNKN